MMLKEKVTLITGSTRGLGLEMAKYFSENCNALVVVCSRNLESLEKVKKIIRGTIMTAKLDVTKRDEIEMTIKTIEEKYGRIDILINNAGFEFDKKIWYKKFHEVELNIFDKIIKVDLMGSIMLSQLVIKNMLKNYKKNKSFNGVIINISSTPAINGHVEGSPYTIAKAGIMGLTKHIAREYGTYNIRAYTLALGNISTYSTYNSMDKEHRLLAKKETSLKRWGRPREVAKIAASLASNNFTYATGNTFVIDGGTIMI